MTEAEKINQENKNKEEKKPKILKEISSAVNYCFNCNRCVTICPLSQLGIFYPRELLNDLNFLSLDEVLKKNNIWECLTCGECMSYCPMTKDEEGVKIPELILELRKISQKLEDQQEKLLQCETHDGMFTLIPQLMAENPSAPDKLAFIKENHLKVATEGELA